MKNKIKSIENDSTYKNVLRLLKITRDSKIKFPYYMNMIYLRLKNSKNRKMNLTEKVQRSRIKITKYVLFKYREDLLSSF